ncbi:hypothetical protein [Frankia sp. R82]|uniref:hypothetical protein n=1 Tax=Frankia sp. R82 TaxID=2950553 RepID=UPI0020433E4A|nr:hypothetical protein [Frankia sp. R82]MCM3885132.1 hypothetical protein [Frankia sp. R82]
MNFETDILIDTVVGEVQDALRNGDRPALAVLEGEPTRELRSPFYLRDAATAAEFEQRLARELETIDVNATWTAH